MGIARFYRYLSERYPLINEKIDVEELPEFDNLYLDMNGIVHNCSHGNTGGRQHALDADLWATIFEYISRLCMLVKPQKLIYLAVDGVAPRAKMNQQRARRFRAAEDGRQARLDNELYGVENNKLPFDSNCITPGTEFMGQLSEQLKIFIAAKMKNDPLWRRCEIIFSGPEVPGEGEHKIMDFLRTRKSQDGYDPNLRHCLYGLDADLIMLSLASHEPNFSLLREEVKFGRNETETAEDRLIVSREKFQLLHICIVREYLDLEFRSHAKNEHYTFDVERVIDDFILFCFLVGNDFLPHLPMTEIRSNGLEILYAGYKQHLERCDATDPWLSHRCGDINWPRLREFFTLLVEQENDALQDRLDRSDYNLGLRRRLGAEECFSDGDNSEPRSGMECVDTIEEARRQYYLIKMGFDINTEEGRSARNTLMQSYCEGMQWILWYYYRGPNLASWKWYFRHYYTPFIFDLCLFEDFENLRLEFPKGNPVSAFEQLMSVLPAASSTLVPQRYQKLFHKDSPIQHFYPLTFELDMDDVKVPWGGVALIPFIDPALLREALDEVEQSSPLTLDEERRNAVSDALLYSAREHGEVHVLAYQHPPSLDESARFPNRVPDGWRMTKDLPTLFQKAEPPSAHLSRGVVVFGTKSRSESLYITVKTPALTVEDIERLEKESTVCFNFPTRAQVGKIVRLISYADSPGHSAAVNDALWTYRQNGLILDCGTSGNDKIAREMAMCEVKLIKEVYANDAGEVEYALAEKSMLRFASLLTPVDIKDRLKRPDVAESMVAICTEDGCARGEVGEVVKIEPVTGRFMVKEAFSKISTEFSKIGRNVQRKLKWFTLKEMANMAKIPEKVANRLVASVWWKTSQHVWEDIGMNLMHAREGGDPMCCTNYATLIKEQGGMRWKFSSIAVAAVIDYVQKFPQLISALKADNREMNTKILFPKEQPGDTFRLLKYVKSQPYKTMKLASARYMALTKEAVDALRAEVDKRMQTTERREVISAEVYIPALGGRFPKDLFQGRFIVGTRVGYRKKDGCVNFGASGTVIGVYDGSRPMCDVLLDEEHFGASTCQNRCPVYRGIICDQNDVFLLGSVEGTPSGKNSLKKPISVLDGAEVSAETAQVVGKRESKKASPITGKRIPHRTHRSTLTEEKPAKTHRDKDTRIYRVKSENSEVQKDLLNGETKASLSKPESFEEKAKKRKSSKTTIPKSSGKLFSPPSRQVDDEQIASIQDDSIPPRKKHSSRNHTRLAEETTTTPEIRTTAPLPEQPILRILKRKSPKDKFEKTAKVDEFDKDFIPTFYPTSTESGHGAELPRKDTDDEKCSEMEKRSYASSQPKETVPKPGDVPVPMFMKRYVQ